MKDLIFLLILTAVFSCKNNPNTRNIVYNKENVLPTPHYDTSVITGSLRGNETVSFYYTNEYGDTNLPFFLSKKDSIKKLIIRYPALLIDTYNQIPLLIYPGEKITISLDGNGLLKPYGGKNEIRNNELNFFIGQFKKKDFLLNSSLSFISPDKYKIAANKFDYRALVKGAEESYHERKIFLKEYQKEFDVSDQFVKYTSTLFKYFYYLRLLTPTQLQNIDISILPKDYFILIDSLIKSGFTCDSCLPNYAYQLASVSMDYYLGRDFKNKSNQFSLLYDTTSKVFSGNTKRYLLFMQLKKNMALMPESYVSRMDSFLNEKTDIYNSYLLDNYLLVKKMEGNDSKELININGDKINWQELLKKYAGNLLYVDFWASWCVPCRKEMPASMKLENQLKDKKVSSIYLSIDKDATDWKSAVNEEGFNKENSFLILNNTESAIGKRFKIKSIPRYMLIGKDGKIISDNAPSPSDKIIMKLIEENL